MTAYDLVEKRDKLKERIAYLNECLNKLGTENPNAPITLTRSKIVEIKMDYFGYMASIDDELKKR